MTVGIRFARIGFTVLSFGLACCTSLGVDYTPVKDIVRSPATYDGKEVRLRGIAKSVTKVPLLDLRAFVIAQDGAEILVFTNGQLPVQDHEVAVRGIVESAAILNGEAIGLRVRETERL